jgi:hypothetical protein
MAAARRQHGIIGGSTVAGGVSSAVVAAVTAWRWQAVYWQHNGGGHGRGRCRYRRAASVRRRGGDIDTGSNSNGGGTDYNQQSTKRVAEMMLARTILVTGELS